MQKFQTKRAILFGSARTHHELNRGAGRGVASPPFENLFTKKLFEVSYKDAKASVQFEDALLTSLPLRRISHQTGICLVLTKVSDCDKF